MATPTKAPRQATACEWCRSHKLKCDTEQPACKNCARRGIPCTTINLRKPGAEGRREPPTGRRRRASPRTGSATPASSFTVSTKHTDRTENIDTSFEGSLDGTYGVYPPSPLQPVGRDFETRSPDRILPSVFAAPFDREDSGSVPYSRSPRLQGGQLTRAQPVYAAPDDPSPHGPNERHNSLSDSSVTLITDSSHGTPKGQAGGHASSQHVLVQWVDLFFTQNPVWEPVFPHFRQGLAYTAEMPLPLFAALPSLPSAADMSKYTTLFFSKIHPIFPVVDRLAFEFSLSELRRKMGHLPSAHLESRDYPVLACAYAIFSLASDEETSGVSKEGTRYLEAVYFLYAHLVAIPYFSSVQALLLLTLVLRNRNKDAASWGSLGQAIRIAQAIGLHRRTPLPTANLGTPQDPEAAASPPHSVMQCDSPDIHGRVWWTAYILERTMELETGRPSAIRDDECAQPVPDIDTSCSFDYFHHLIGLAKIKTSAIHLLYSGKHQRKPVKELLFEMGKVDRALLDWADKFPESIRPGRDIFCGGGELHLATYVALQYHQTMIALHRPALMSAPGFLRNRINEYCTGTPWRDRLHFSLCIGAASARSVLKATNDLAMYAGLSRIITADQILLAVLVLGIYVAKVPLSRLNRSDLALVDSFGEQVEEEYVNLAHSAEFVKGITLFRTQLCNYISGVNKHARAALKTNNTASISDQETSTDMMLEGLDFNTDLTNLEESWSCFWNEDFDRLLSHQTEPDMTNMYLLGIPQSWP